MRNGSPALKTKFIVHPIKLVASLATFAVTLALAVSGFAAGRPIPGAVFLAIALIFLAITPIFGATLTVDETGVCRRFLGRVTRTLSWSEIAEVGVAGSKVLKRAGSDRTGEIFIYFSPLPLDDQARFEMMLKWPPKEQLFMYCTDPRLRTVLFYSDKTPKTYNVGEDFLLEHAGRAPLP